MSDLEPADQAANHEVFVGEYANIYRYLNLFQVEVDDKSQLLTRANAALDQVPITVFKKKNLRKFSNTGPNIYEHNLTMPDVDQNDKLKLKVSCVRCRKYKKKCLRQFPECLNCTSSDELCIYLPRKSKRRNDDDRQDRSGAPQQLVKPESSQPQPLARSSVKKHNLDMLLN